jgi:hypothetical protein
MRTITTFLLCAGGASCDRGGAATARMAISLDAPSRKDAPARLPYLYGITVEENDAVVNVNPSLVPDPWGGFLVVDVSESQIRRYSEDGGLLWHAGRRGQGPGEFTAPVGVGRLPAGRVVAAERNGRLTFFDSTGSTVDRTVETRIAQVAEMVVVDDSTLLLSGIGRGGAAGPRLHLWNVGRDTLLRSFFAPFPNQRNRAAATVAGYTEAAVRNDTVAAVFAASDTVYLFTLDGRPAGQLPLASAHFRPAPEREPGRTITHPVERAQWVSTFDFTAEVGWLPDGSLLVAYQSIDADRALTRRWHLLGMTRRGERTFEYRDFSRLLGVDARSGLVYLVDPSAEAPNEWRVARLP